MRPNAALSRILLAVTTSQLVLALSLCRAVGAQGPPLKPGDRIRLTVPTVGTNTFVATMESASVDTIRVRTSRGVMAAFPLDRVARLEVSRGVRRPTWSKTAPLWLPLVGLVGGAAGGSSKPASREKPQDAALVIGVTGATVGLLVGTVIAIAVPRREKWDTVPTGSGHRTSLAPSLYAAPAARGVTVGLRASF
jgi:protein involved in polysaccharide export with SLBB domain